MPRAAIDRAASTTGELTTRAIVQHRYGADPDQVLTLEAVPPATAAAGQVLVRVAAASVDLGTWHLMTGMPVAMRLVGFGVRAPKASNPGRAFAGTVAAVGSDDIELAVGDEVYGTGDGSFAELMVVAADHLAVKPSNLTFEQAAAAPISGVTALQAVRQAGVQRGQKVLITGAAGGVGSFAVQIAKALGAEVTGVASTTKIDLVTALGADHVIDYLQGDLPGRPERYDVIIDIAGNRRLSDLRRALTRKGALVIVGGETDGRLLAGFGRALRAVLLSPFVSQSLGMLASTENAEDLSELRELIESGAVVPAIDATYALDQAAAAIRHVSEGRARGKVVITV